MALVLNLARTAHFVGFSTSNLSRWAIVMRGMPPALRGGGFPAGYSFRDMDKMVDSDSALGQGRWFERNTVDCYVFEGSNGGRVPCGFWTGCTVCCADCDVKGAKVSARNKEHGFYHGRGRQRAFAVDQAGVVGHYNVKRCGTQWIKACQREGQRVPVPDKNWRIRRELRLQQPVFYLGKYVLPYY